MFVPQLILLTKKLSLLSLCSLVGIGNNELKGALNAIHAHFAVHLLQTLILNFI